jgi:hypothetical protein
MIVKLPNDFLINTKSIVACYMDKAPYNNKGFTHYIYIEYMPDNEMDFHYLNKEEAEKDFTKIEEIISKAINLKTNEDGAFICAHCGAPNV